MRNRLVLFGCLVIWGLPQMAAAHWTFELGSGWAANARMPLVVHQRGQKDLDFTARYESRLFEPPPYYQMRFAHWDGDRAWEFEHLHHKIYLDNKPGEIQHFSISHGYNMYTINRVWTEFQFLVRVGGGVIIGHPESMIRGLKLNDDRGGFLKMGYYISGPTAQIAVERRWQVADHVFIGVEAKATASYARVPVRRGYARTPLLAIHGLLHLGFNA